METIAPAPPPPSPRPRRRRRRQAPPARLAAALARQWVAADPTFPGLPGGGASSRAARLARHHLLPLLAYLLVALAVSYPLVRRFGTALPGDGGDAWQNLWNYWWLRRALAAGQNPYWTDLLYAPDGTALYLHTLNPFNGLVSLPVQVAFGLTAAYNTVVILSLVLAAYFAYLLVGFVAGSRLAGFIGGVIYAFGSYHLAHLLGHANLVASEWLPAYLLCLLAAPAATGARRWWLIGAGALALALLALCDWQYVLFAAIVTALWVPWATVARRSVVPPVAAGLAGLIALALLAPLLIPTVRMLRDTAATRPPVPGADYFSADLVSFVVPSSLQAWWGGAAEAIGGRAFAIRVERSIFLGVLPVALAACGLWFGRRRAAFWGLAAAFFAALALGPTLQVLGRRFGGVPLPYRLLERLPIANTFRVPARFGLLVTLCLAVLAGIGLVGLARRFPALAAPRARLVAVPLLTLALLAEHFPAPYPLVPVVAPPAYRQLAASGEAGAVLNLPFSLTDSVALFGQTVHGKPIVGGYLSRPLAYPLLALPPFTEPAPERQAADLVAMTSEGVGAWALRLAGVGWIAVPRDTRDRATAAIVARYAAPTPAFEDDTLILYRPLPPGTPRFYLLPADGWHQPERLPDGRPMRWLPDRATLDTWALADAPLGGTLRFEAWSFNRPRRLAIEVDGVRVAEWLVAEPQGYAVPLTLAPGRHTIALVSLDPPERPSRTVGGADTRLIGIGVAAVELR